MLKPAGEAPAAACEPGSRVGGHERGFDGERAGAAQRVQERTARREDRGPAGGGEDGGRERLLHRRLDLDTRLAVTAAVERLARQVERDRGLVLSDHDVDAQVRIGRVDTRSHAHAVDEPVRDRVLHANRGELRVAQRVVHPGGVDGDGPVGTHVVLPRPLADRGVQCVGRIGRHAREREQYTRREPRPQQRAVAGRQTTTEAHSGAQRSNAAALQYAQLAGEQRFSAAGARGEELEGLVHGRSAAAADARVDCSIAAEPPKTRKRTIVVRC